MKFAFVYGSINAETTSENEFEFGLKVSGSKAYGCQTATGPSKSSSATVAFFAKNKEPINVHAEYKSD